MVSPGNPLKRGSTMATAAERLASAARLADGRRIIATDIESRLGTQYTADTLIALRTRFPLIRFIWLMGADNLEQLPRWDRWRRIARTMPFAVFPRPTYNHRALAGQAAQTLRDSRRRAEQAGALSAMPPPAWMFLPAPQHAASATALRAASNGQPATAPGPNPKPGMKTKTRPKHP
jgi:nicotinate-nucleotide adenylyltransferase